MSKLDLAIIATAIFGAALIEGGHRIVIDAPAKADIVMRVPVACPDNDNVPYSAACIAFLEGRTLSNGAAALVREHVAMPPPMR